MKEKHHNPKIRVNSDGRLCIDNQVVDFDMILFEEEAKNLLEQELMEGPHYYYQEEDELISENDDADIIPDEDQIQEDDIYFNGGYHDISNDEFDARF
jgi:hypothetical protein